MDKTCAGLQLIVFGERNRTDFGGVLADARAAGFEAIEGGNLFDAHGEDTVRRLLGEHGVSVCGTHMGYGDYAEETPLKANIAYSKALGVRHMICSGVSDPKSVAGYVESARLFNAVGKRLRDEGIVFHYHNHAFEFEDLGGTNGITILAADTDPEFVKFNIDVFWVTIGGASPAEFIRKNSKRAGYYHFKDGRKLPDGGVEFLELGTGEVDLVGAMQAAREAGAEWIVAEQDRTTLPHRQSVTITRAYMRDKLGV